MIQHVLERCGELRELDISSCEAITRAIVKAIGEFIAVIASKSAKFKAVRMEGQSSFRFLCEGSSILAQPGELETELKVAHPALKFVRQSDEKDGEETRLASLYIWWQR